MQYLSAYLMEWSLSIDNIFVFIIIFASFGVKEKHYGRVLLIGISNGDSIPDHVHYSRSCTGGQVRMDTAGIRSVPCLHRIQNVYCRR